MKKIIGVDLDSTLIENNICAKAAKKLGYDYTEKDVTDWYYNNFPEDMRTLAIQMFRDPFVMCEDDIRPIEGSQQKITEWTNRGYEIVLITARVAAIHEATIKLVNRLYPEIKNINFVDFNESKIDVMVRNKVQIWIDDAPHGVIDAMSLHIPTILISNNLTKYNWKVRQHPRLHSIVKRIEQVSNEMIPANNPW